MENFVFTLIDTSDSTKLYSSHGHVHNYIFINGKKHNQI